MICVRSLSLRQYVVFKLFISTEYYTSVLCSFLYTCIHLLISSPCLRTIVIIKTRTFVVKLSFIRPFYVKKQEKHLPNVLIKKLFCNDTYVSNKSIFSKQNNVADNADMIKFTCRLIYANKHSRDNLEHT